MTVKKEQTIRLSITALGVVIGGVILLGMAGGMVAQFFLPAAAPLTGKTEPVLTTVQEVTISPSKAAVKVVEQTQRSVLLLGDDGTGFVLTSDGLVVSPIELKAATPAATDERGLQLPLETVGRDSVYGLSYYRLKNAVLPPLDIRRDDPGMAAQLLVVGRSVSTWQPRVATYTLQEYVLPPDGGPQGWHRLLRGAPLDSDVLPGSPLLDEEGKVSGVVVDATQGFALPVTQLTDSLNRVVANKREQDPFEELGITARPVFGVFAPERPVALGLQLTSVRPQSPAATAGLKAGDSVIGLNQTAFTWNNNPAAVLRGASRPLTVMLMRNQAEQTITVP